MHFGHKIMIGFSCFALLMGVLVYKSLNTTFELVSKDYYKDELNYQEIIDASASSNKLNGAIQININQDTIDIQLPEMMTGKQISGEVFFYCASNSKKDKRFALNEAKLSIKKWELQQGTYTVKTKWTSEGVPYYNEQNLIIP